MWRRQEARVSILRLSLGRLELLGREFVREAIRYSIFFSRPPKVTLALKSCEASSPFEEYSLCTCMQEKNESQRKFFSLRQPYQSTSSGRSHAVCRAGDSPLVINSAKFFSSLSSHSRSHSHEASFVRPAGNFRRGKFRYPRPATLRIADARRGRSLRRERSSRRPNHAGRPVHRLHGRFHFPQR